MTRVFKLIEKDTVPAEVKYRGKVFTKNEERYTYQSENGDVLQFQADPHKDFNWIFGSKSTPGGIKNAREIITAFVKAGMDQHQYVGGFDEAVATLTIR